MSDAHAAAPAGKKSKVKIFAIVGIVIAVQCALAFMFLPGGAQADSKKAQDKTAKSAENGEDHGKSSEAREVDLGQFNLTTFNPNSNTTLVIDFHLYGTVAVEHEEIEAKGAKKEEPEKKEGEKKGGEEPDNTKFGKQLKRCKHRFREQVIVIIRNAEMGDLSDPGLGLIKRQILAKTNSLLGEPLLKEVIFSDFAVVEQ